MKKRVRAGLILVLVIICHLLVFPLPVEAKDTIKLTLVSEVDTAHWGVKKICNHYYFIHRNGVEVVPKTLFPNDETTVIELPKTKEAYTITFGYDGVYSTGQPNPFDMVEGVAETFPGNKSKKYTFSCSFRGALHMISNTNRFSMISDIFNTNAAETAGETSMPIPAVIVIGLAAAAAAAAGAGAAGAAAGTGGISGAGSSEASENSEEGSSYKMYIYKEFGDKIKYGGETVFVYARMVEVTAEGMEVERPDLTQQIEISSPDSFLTVSAAAPAGAYMASSISADIDQRSGAPAEGTISFRFTGEGGAFQNNVIFQMVGEAVIELDSQNLYVLAASQRTFSLPYQLVDFLQEAEVSVSPMSGDCPFDLSIGKDQAGNAVIMAVDREEKKPFTRFFDSYSCEIIAQNEKEYARSVFDVVMCHEGLLPDFLGKPHEIRGYRNDEGEMEQTLIAFKLGIWNETDRILDFTRPNEVAIECTDDDGIFEVIGLTSEQDTENFSQVDDAVYYIFQAKIPFPHTAPIQGRLIAYCSCGDIQYENETQIELIPDIQQYQDNLELEYERCKYIINTYIAEGWRDKKLDQLEKARPGFGIKDYQLFRKNCWQFAQNLIMQEKESYLKQSYSADIAIAYLEIYVYIGDVAFDIALMPVGGPIAGFLIGQAKSTALELISLRIEKGNIGYDELTELLIKRIEQASGQADGAVEMPKPNEPRKLATWLACFFLYRFVWHWYWSKDENNQQIGIAGALEKAALDFAGKAVGGMLGNFVDKIAEKSSLVGAVQKVYSKDKDEALAKPVTDIGGKAFAAINELVSTLEDFLTKIKNGLA